MRPERREGRVAATAIALLTARRAVRSAVPWGVVFGTLIANEALAYRSNFPTRASRQQLAETFGRNDALAAMVGPARRVDTVGGFLAWRVFGLLILVGAVWGLLTATRLLRGEEDAGRWELLLAGRTTRARAAAQGLAGLAGGFAVLWSLTAIATVAAGTRPSVGFSVMACVYYATAVTASALMFLAIGALTSQLGATRREASGLAAAVFGVAFVLRLVADSAASRGGLRWLTPLGWVENLRPLTGAQPAALVPIVVLTAAAALAAIALAGRRDLAAGVVRRRPGGPARRRLLDGPVALAFHLERWVALSWVIGLALLALVFGIIARVAAGAQLAGSSLEEAVTRLGGTQGGAAAWIGYELVYVAALVAFAAAGQIGALRDEEAEGRLDHLLARPVGRARWLAGRVGLAAAFVALASMGIALGGWAGVATGRTGVSLAAMLGAGVNVAAPALLVLGIGVLLYGIAPRIAVPTLYALILWSFVAELIGSSITSSRWVLDTSVLAHLGPVPAAPLDWPAVMLLGLVGVLAAVVGVAAFRRRDLAAA